MKYYIIAGEASGDLHGSNLAKHLRIVDKDAHIRGWGGDLMMSSDVEIVKHYKETAFMGFWEVVSNLHKILRNLKFCEEDILKYKPDALILIDYPGFNLRISDFAKKKGFLVFYYISPQIWAWKSSRIHKIVRNSAKVFTILPFEKDFYKKYGYDVEYVGHPLIDAIEEFKDSNKKDFISRNNLNSRPLIALLPGSRVQEIKRMLPVFLSVTKNFKDFQFVIAGIDSLADYYLSYLKYYPDVKVVYNQTYSLLLNSVAAIVTSGTATLETALLNVPMIVCYKANKFSYEIAKRIVKVEYISLVNLILGKEIVKELIQEECNRERIIEELEKLLYDSAKVAKMKNDFNLLRKMLGETGASQKVAEIIFNEIKSKR